MKNKTATLSLTTCLPEEMNDGHSGVVREDDSSCFMCYKTKQLI